MLGDCAKLGHWLAGCHGHRRVAPWFVRPFFQVVGWNGQCFHSPGNMRSRPFFMLALGAALVHAATACMDGGDPLNPQPLPPHDPGGEHGTGSEAPGRGDDDSNSPGAGADADAGTDADADGGADADAGAAADADAGD